MTLFERFLTLPEVHITRDYPLVAHSTHFALSRQATVEVRPIQGFEAEELQNFFESVVMALPCYSAEAKAGELAKYTAHELCDRIHDDLESVLVARVHDKLVGFCFSNKDDQAIWLAWLGVHPDYRRLGIGKLLLDRLEQRAKRLASHKIWCDSRTDNRASAALLRRQGYEQICTLRRHWYRQDFFIWEKFVV